MSCPTHQVTIWIGGDLSIIRNTLAKYCGAKGFCVSVTPTEFIYSGGVESGASIGIINYARFPAEHDLEDSAIDLAYFLLRSTHQRSCSVIVASGTTYFIQNNAISSRAAEKGR